MQTYLRLCRRIGAPPGFPARAQRLLRLDPPPDFVQPKDLHRHELEVHNVCNGCYTMFYRRSEVKDHREFQHGVK